MLRVQESTALSNTAKRKTVKTAFSQAAPTQAKAARSRKCEMLETPGRRCDSADLPVSPMGVERDLVGPPSAHFAEHAKRPSSRPIGISPWPEGVVDVEPELQRQPRLAPLNLRNRGIDIGEGRQRGEPAAQG